MISTLQLKNFAAFTELNMEFSSGINIIIGENGTGKTLLLKSILALCSPEVYTAQPEIKLSEKLCRLYQPTSGKVGELRRSGTRGASTLHAEFSQGQKLLVSFNSRSSTVRIPKIPAPIVSPATFLPTKEVLSLVRGLISEQSDPETIERIFDDSYLSLANQLKKEGIEDVRSRVQLNPRSASIIPRLTNLIGGQYLLDKGRFVFQSGRYDERKASTQNKSQHARMYQDSTEWRFIPTSKKRFSSTMTAEGFRKIGVLQRLLSNGTLDPENIGPLLWDEPESNLNPKLMKDLVQTLLELARNGQQIILATHDYVLLKWFDLLIDSGKGDHVRFFSLYRDMKTHSITTSRTDDYLSITPNPIDDAFGYLLDQVITNDMGELGK